ncbi:helix-turn-helix domain-containing protein [Arthrobacter cavernae]|uniref:Helix-turn-helix transcriptional regulator n=1 Tax=Arthrobacter cavernae TaxID=2817681 RepID=A0A939KJI9_9MICC|nr:helix-turn-helix transcriptional regulator [Arthrobacter cavernae]MBO1267779.1 helix-turn-helix transcriptional regulator [Arthrobacter cavernae]
MTSGTRIHTPAAVDAIVRARRQDRGLSQESLAEATGVSR